MQPTTLDKLAWTLIYGGLLVLALGLAVQRTEAGLGWTLASAGGVVAVAGALLIVVRSRMRQGRGQ
jgi:hypothetical protein